MIWSESLSHDTCRFISGGVAMGGFRLGPSDPSPGRYAGVGRPSLDAPSSGELLAPQRPPTTPRTITGIAGRGVKGQFLRAVSIDVGQPTDVDQVGDALQGLEPGLLLLHNVDAYCADRICHRAGMRWSTIWTNRWYGYGIAARGIAHRCVVAGREGTLHPGKMARLPGPVACTVKIDAVTFSAVCGIAPPNPQRLPRRNLSMSSALIECLVDLEHPVVLGIGEHPQDRATSTDHRHPADRRAGLDRLLGSLRGGGSDRHLLYEATARPDHLGESETVADYRAARRTTRGTAPKRGLSEIGPSSIWGSEDIVFHDVRHSPISGFDGDRTAVIADMFLHRSRLARWLRR